METMVLDKPGQSTFLINTARLVKADDDLADLAAEAGAAGDWAVEKSNPMIKWIAGDFAEADNPNRNKQFWTAKDLAMAEYTIRHAPLNMVHKFRQPVGFFAATKTVKLKQPKLEVAGAQKTERQGSMKIQALSGLWSHIFSFEAAQADAADEAGLLFYSMECRGEKLTCGSDEASGIVGCGQTFDYLDVESHCEHLLERASIRHIVNPVFRGGALIIPPVRPGWAKAHANVLTDSVMQEAAAFAEQTEEQYKAIGADGALSASAWEQMMGLVVAATQH